MGRDYRQERRDYYGYGKYEDQTAEQKRHRREKAARNSARATLKKEGKVKKGQDVHHKDGNPLNNKRSNLQATSRSYNRSRNKK
jgi:hypothetical protein